MKRKVEKYLYSKNIDGVHRLKDSRDRYLIGDDIDGCLRAARQAPASHGKPRPSAGPTPLKVKVGAGAGSALKVSAGGSATPGTAGGSARKKRKADQLNSLFSPAVAPKAKSLRGASEGPQASAQDHDDLAEFCRSLRGGYVDGIYRSAVERRKMAEGVAGGASLSVLTNVLNDLNLSVDERSRLPAFFRENVVRLLDDYKSPPAKAAPSSASSSIGGGGALAPPSTRKAPPATPFQDFGDMAIAGSSSAAHHSLLQAGGLLQLRPSPVTSKKERENLETVTFNPFSPETRRMTEEMAAASSTASTARSDHAAAKTPERVKPSGIGMPGSAFSSFSPFISPNYMEKVMSQGITMTPAIVDSARHSLEAPPSWEAVDANMINEAFNPFGETPSRNLDGLLEATGNGPKMPTTEELARSITKLPEGVGSGHDVHRPGGEGDRGGVPIINTAFSFSDVLSPHKEEDPTDKVLAVAVTDSGPLRMRFKGNADLSTHHFDAWQSPAGNMMSQGTGTQSEESTGDR